MLARRKRSIAIALAIAGITLLWASWPHVRAAAFLADMAGTGGLARRLLPVETYDVTTEALEIPTRHGPVDARIMRPVSAVTRTVVLVPGVHAGGFEEPRLKVFATRLASAG